MTATRNVSRIARVLCWSALGILLAVYVGVPVAMAIAATWPSRAIVSAPPAGFRDVTLTTADGTELAAWYAESRNGAAIIVAHGAGGSRENVRRHAQLMADRGYGVLSLDFQGHGESGGRTNRLGWQGTSAVRAAVDYLATREGGALRIGGIGSSMGGEVLLGASAQCPEIEAIVADGATRRCTEELLALPQERSLVRSFTARVMYQAVRLLAWDRPPAPLLGEMRRSESSFLLISAGANQLETAFNRRFAQVLGSRADLWIVPGVAHTGAYTRYPDDYERRVISFFDAHLLTGD